MRCRIGWYVLQVENLERVLWNEQYSLTFTLLLSAPGKRLRQDEDDEMDMAPSTSERQERESAQQRQYRGQRIETPSYPGKAAFETFLEKAEQDMRCEPVQSNEFKGRRHQYLTACACLISKFAASRGSESEGSRRHSRAEEGARPGRTVCHHSA